MIPRNHIQGITVKVLKESPTISSTCLRANKKVGIILGPDKTIQTEGDSKNLKKS